MPITTAQTASPMTVPSTRPLPNASGMPRPTLPPLGMPETTVITATPIGASRPSTSGSCDMSVAIMPLTGTQTAPAHRLMGHGAGATQTMAPLARPLPPRGPLAAPHEGRGGEVPALHRRRQPRHYVVSGFGVLAVQRP